MLEWNDRDIQHKIGVKEFRVREKKRIARSEMKEVRPDWASYSPFP